MELLKQVTRTDGSIQVKWDVGDAILAPTGVGYVIEWLWVDPDLRARGLGRACLAYLKTLFGGVLEPVDVLDNAKPFWAQMAREGLCAYVEGHYI